MRFVIRLSLTSLFLCEAFLLQRTLNLVRWNGGVSPPPIIPMWALELTILLLCPTVLTWWTLRCIEVQNPSVPLLAAALGPLNTMLTPTWTRPTKTMR